MGILCDYQVDRDTLDVLAAAGILTTWGPPGWTQYQNSDGNTVARIFHEHPGLNEIDLPRLTDALLRFIEAEGLILEADSWLVEIWADTDRETGYGGSGASLPLAVADYIKRKGE